MILLFNNKGQLLESLEYGQIPYAGTTNFKVIAIIQGLTDLDGVTASLKLYKPDLDASSYPLLMMNKDTNFVFNSSIEQSQYLQNGTNYPAFVFDFNDFGVGENAQERIVLLDTPGQWLSTVCVIGDSFNVQGQAKINVLHGVSNEEETEATMDLLLSNIAAQLALKLDLNSAFYLRVVSGINNGILIDIVNRPEDYNANAILFARDTHKFYQILDMQTGAVSEIVLELDKLIVNHAYKGSESEENELITNGEADDRFLKLLEGIVVKETLASLNLDIANYNNGQLFYVKALNQFYINNNGVAKVFSDLANNHIGFITLQRNHPVLYIATDEQMAEVRKQHCLIYLEPASIYSGEIYVKAEYVPSYDYFIFNKIGQRYSLVGSNTTGYTQALQDNITINNDDGHIVFGASVKTSFYAKNQADYRFAKLNEDNTFSGNNTFTGSNTFTYSPQTNDSDYGDGTGTKLTTKNYVQNIKSAIEDEIEDINKVIPSGASENNKLIVSGEKGSANGIATLDDNQKIPTSQLPDVVLSNMQRAGGLYIINSDTTLSQYDLLTSGFLRVLSSFKNEFNLTTVNEITLNGITYRDPSNSNLLIKFSDLSDALGSLSDDKKKEILNDFFIVVGIVNESGINYSTFVDKTLRQSVYVSNTQVSTGDWLIINDIFSVGGTGYLFSFEKLDNTDAVVSVNNKSGIVVLDGTDISLSTEDSTKVTTKFGNLDNDISTINSKLPKTKDFVIPVNAWHLNELDNYDTFTDTSDYVGYYVIYNSQYEKVTNDNKDDLSIVAGTTVAYTGKFFAQLDAGNDFVIDDDFVKLYTPTGNSDNLLIMTYGINATSDETTQKFTFICNIGDEAPDEVVNYTITMFGGN